MQILFMYMLIFNSFCSHRSLQVVQGMLFESIFCKINASYLEICKIFRTFARFLYAIHFVKNKNRY